MVKAFKGTVHVFNLRGEIRKVVDPRSIPLDIRDALCQRNNYWLDSIIGPNQEVAHFDLRRQNWRDMRYAQKVNTLTEQNVSYDEITGVVAWT